MRSAHFGRLALRWLLSFGLMGALAGCHPDLFGSGSDNSTAAPAFRIGGMVSGLIPGATLTLQDNGADSLTLDSDGVFTFAKSLPANSSYAVTVATMPAGEACTVSDGAGTVSTGDVANVVVTCTDQAFPLGGSIQGLSVPGLVLANGSTTITVSAGATSFVFPAAVAVGSSYNVTISAQPTDFFCKLSGGSGTMSANGATGMTMVCFSSAFTLGGTVQGLTSSGLILANGSDLLTVQTGASTFTFPTLVSFGGHYDVTVSTQPAGLTCTVSSGSGTMRGTAITSVAVSCAPEAFDLGGTIQGLSSSGLILANGGATVTVPSGAQSFIFPTPVAIGTSFNVTVMNQPAGLSCSVFFGSGTMPANAVTSVVVACAVPTFLISGTISGLGNNTGLVLANGAVTLDVPASATYFSMPTSLPVGASYNVTVAANPAAGPCTIVNGSGIIAGNVNNIQVICHTGIESVLYSFAGPPGDGAAPWFGNLTLGSDGNFYGMTSAGGASNGGTVFRVTPAGVETLLWSFGSGSDGSFPLGSLILAHDGNFYGLTESGGVYGSGTVFRITPAGVETVLWSFGAFNDGADPSGSLIEGSDGNFYGTTSQCNSASCRTYTGAVFKITPAGVESVLWTPAGATDAQAPMGNLVQASDGNFYGTSTQGGANGAGTIFRISPAGAEAVLWSFGGNGDGANPHGTPVLGADGAYYGVTPEGGADGVGVAYRFTLGGAESVLYSFTNIPDGSYPEGNLVLGPNGNFFGMSYMGGNANLGTIFQITPAGVESVLWTFYDDSGADGFSPYGSLIVGPNGNLYGMTSAGGAYNQGAVITIK